MSRGKKIWIWVLSVFAFLNFLLVVTGHSYIYKGVANTYLKGRTSPSINDLEVFTNRSISKGKPQPWNLAQDYNKGEITYNQLTELAALQTTVLLIIRKDSILLEHYWDDGGQNNISNSFSMAKSFVAALVGAAIQDGKIKSLDEPIRTYLPEFSRDGKYECSVRDLLSMSSGINFEDETYNGPFDFPAKAYFGTDLENLISNYSVQEEPNKIFNYHSGTNQVLSFVLANATDKTISDYASEKLWQPLGMEADASWSLDHDGGKEKSYCCIYSTARDFARLGKLYLNKGVWNGERIIPEKYITESIVLGNLKEKDGRNNERYGLGWWLLRYNEHKIYYARGIRGQYIIVIPDEQTIIVRLGHQRNKPKDRDHPLDLYTYIEIALQQI